MVNNSLKHPSNFAKFHGDKVQYQYYFCSKFKKKSKHEKMVFTNFKSIFILVRRRRKRKIRRKSGNFQEQISHEPLAQSMSNSVCKVRYMQSIKYVNLIEIRSVVFKIREVEIGEILVRVNNTRVLDTRGRNRRDFGTRK